MPKVQISVNWTVEQIDLLILLLDELRAVIEDHSADDLECLCQGESEAFSQTAEHEQSAPPIEDPF